MNVDAVDPVLGEGLDHHPRTEVRAADPEMDDGVDRRAGRPGPLAPADRVGDALHLALD
jgi:hypothetical protein